MSSSTTDLLNKDLNLTCVKWQKVLFDTASNLYKCNVAVIVFPIINFTIHIHFCFSELNLEASEFLGHVMHSPHSEDLQLVNEAEGDGLVGQDTSTIPHDCQDDAESISQHLRRLSVSGRNAGYGAGLCTIPVELLLKICDYLPAPFVIRTLALVCKYVFACEFLIVAMYRV